MDSLSRTTLFERRVSCAFDRRAVAHEGPFSGFAIQIRRVFPALRWYRILDIELVMAGLFHHSTPYRRLHLQSRTERDLTETQALPLRILDLIAAVV